MTPETSNRLLIVDDDAQICELLSDYLKNFGFLVETAPEGVSAMQALQRGRFDAVILDLMLPGEDGLSLFRKMREISRVPVIMLTARGEISDRVVGLELGADDYLSKPFDPRELVARINAVLRRTQESAAAEAIGNLVAFEGWQLNRTLRQLQAPDGIVVSLSNAEFKLLWVFIERPRQILSRNQLMDATHGRDIDLFDRSIDLLVSRLRQKLEANAKYPQLLRTIRGEGYIFDARVADLRAAR